MGQRTCEPEDCGRPATRRGMCGKHYTRWMKHGDPLKIIVKVRRVCSLVGCGRPNAAHGLCESHNRQRANGQPLTTIRSWRPQLERDDLGRKLCRFGDHWLPEAEFGAHSRNPDGLNYLCRKCARDKHRLENYGISWDRYQEMLATQGGGCAICGQQCSTGRLLAVDHDRSCCPNYIKTCGKCVRGLLCGSCNQGIGKLRDSPLLLRRAAAYLES